MSQTNSINQKEELERVIDSIEKTIGDSLEHLETLVKQHYRTNNFNDTADENAFRVGYLDGTLKFIQKAAKNRVVC